MKYGKFSSTSNIFPFQLCTISWVLSWTFLFLCSFDMILTSCTYWTMKTRWWYKCISNLKWSRIYRMARTETIRREKEKKSSKKNSNTSRRYKLKLINQPCPWIHGNVFRIDGMFSVSNWNKSLHHEKIIFCLFQIWGKLLEKKIMKKKTRKILTFIIIIIMKMNLFSSILFLFSSSQHLLSWLELFSLRYVYIPILEQTFSDNFHHELRIHIISNI